MSLITLERLDISDSSHIHDLILNIDSNGQFFLQGEEKQAYDQELKFLFILKRFNDGEEQNYYEEEFLPSIIKFCSKLIIPKDNKSIEEFWTVLSLTIASYKIKQLIKKDMNLNLIEEIVSHYFHILEVLRSIESPLKNSILLSKCLFISPLLITISFAFKLNYHKSNELVKLLNVLFNYLLIDENTLADLKRLFGVDVITDLTQFEMFKQLWLKTLEHTNNSTKLNEKFQPGPISIIQRLKTLNSEPISHELLNQIIPFISNGFLRNSPKDIGFIISQIKLLNLESSTFIENKKIFLNLLPYLSTNHGTELVFILFRSLKLDDIVLKWYEENEQLRPILYYFFFKFGGISVFSGLLSSTRYIDQIISSDITQIIEISREARFNVLFEIIDHNYKIKLLNDFQLPLTLNMSLSSLNEKFDFQKECYSLSELGSSFSIEAILNYTTFIVQNSLIYSINPNASIPSGFKEIMQLNKFPPLPKSEFLDFTIEDISSKLVNINNFQRLLNIIQLSNEVIQKVLTFKYLNKQKVDLFDDQINGIHTNFAFSTSNSLLEQYFTILFSNLIVSNELSLKSGKNESSNSIFFDLGSISNVLKLQTFYTFELIFKVYGTFAIFTLLKFINSISYQSLELQNFSILVLNHLIFHASTTDFKDAISSDDLLKTLLVDYINEWDDGMNTIYGKLSNFSGIKSKKITKTTLEFSSYLKLLGFENPSPAFSPAPSSTGSTVSNFNSSFNNQYSGNTTVTSQSLSSQGNSIVNNNHNNRFQNQLKNINNHEGNNGLSLNQRNINNSKNNFNNIRSTDNTSEGFNQTYGGYNYSTSTSNITGLSNHSGFTNRNSNFHDTQPFVSQYQQHFQQQQQQQQTNNNLNNNNLNNQNNNFYKNS